jgi:hypothetical protein
MRILVPVLAGVLAIGPACGSVGPSPLPMGVWGGDHIAMTITESSVHLELDCAHGDVPNPITIDARGRFSVAGTFVREHGGPIRQDEVLDARPASYTGSVASNAMTLTIQQTDTNQVIGSFALVRGAQGRVVKCL